MAIISTDDILEYVGLTHEDLKTRCADEDLRQISLQISDWERYAPLLKLTDADIEDIRNRAKKCSVHFRDGSKCLPSRLHLGFW